MISLAYRQQRAKTFHPVADCRLLPWMRKLQGVYPRPRQLFFQNTGHSLTHVFDKVFKGINQYGVTGNLQITQVSTVGFINLVTQLHFQAFLNIFIHHFQDKTVNLIGAGLNIQRNNAAFSSYFLQQLSNRREQAADGLL